jgi:tape measure domain-containing protein
MSDSKELKYRLSLQDLFSKKMQGAAAETKRMDSAMSGLGSRISSVIGTIAVASLGKNIVETTAKFQSFNNAINSASGSASAGAANIKFLNEQVDRLGLDINAAYGGYKTFSGALMGTALEGDKANTVFKQVSEAATVMGLSGEQTEGAFLALGQMMSKGTVSAEELRGQLGERIPGAFQIAARAMGVSTMQLGEMMKKGEVVSEEFLPKFGAELERTFGGKLGTATDSLQSNLNRMNTEWERLKVTIGTEFLPEIIKATKGIASFLKENKETIVTVVKLAGVLGTTIIAFKGMSAVVSGVQTAMSLATTANQMLTLSLGTTLGTVGLLTAGFAALGVAIYGAISSYQEWQDIKSGKGKFDSGVNTEIESVNRLAESYTKMGMSKEKAMQTAIQQERQSIQSSISSLESRLAKDPENFTLQNQLKEYRGELSALSDEKGLVSQFANKNTLASAKGGKASGGSSSSSVGSSTEISAVRPQSITINIGKMVETFELHSTNVTEGFDKIKQKLGNMLAEVANDGNNIAMTH